MADEEVKVEAVETAEAVETELTTEPASRGAERNKDLSEKVKLTATERDKEKSRADAAEKRSDFYKNLGKLSKKYPDASDYEDKILEKVEKGYDIDDATVAVLSKAGKLNMNTQKVERETVAGGSAITTNPMGKGPKDMTQAERLAELRRAESEGFIGLS